MDINPTSQEELAAFSDPERFTRPNTRDIMERWDYYRDIVQKGHFAKFGYCVALVWAGALVFIILGQGLPDGWHLATAEFITVVTTTTASVFGFAAVLGRYLFGSKAYPSHTPASASVAPTLAEPPEPIAPPPNVPPPDPGP